MQLKENSDETLLPDFNSQSARTYHYWRHFKDVTTRYLMAFGGIGVIVAIVLIAFYLLYVVLPMFKPADIDLIATYVLPGDTMDRTLLYAMEEQHEVGLRITDKAEIVFFKTDNGEIRKKIDLNIPDGTTVTSISSGDPAQRMIGLGLSDGSVMFFQHNYKITYPDGTRLITPELDFPFGKEPVQVIEDGSSVKDLSVQYDGEQATIVAHDSSAKLSLVSLTREESMISDETEITSEKSNILLDMTGVIALRVDVEQHELYVADKLGNIYYYNIADKLEPRLIQKVKAAKDDAEITSLEFLSGGISILVGDTRG